MRILFLLFLQFPSIWAQKNLPKQDTTKLKTEQLKEVILIVHTMPRSKFEIKNKTGPQVIFPKRSKKILLHLYKQDFTNYS